MNHSAPRRSMRQRATAVLLALACVLTIFPISALSADAPESTISLRNITWTSTTYQSAYFSRQCQIQHFQMNVGGQTLSGFCGDHSLHLNNQHIGDTWSTPQEVTNSVVKSMMAYYYTHLLGQEYYTDECIAKGFNYQLSEDNLMLVNGWIQEVVWLWSTDQIPSDHDGQVEMVAQAYRESANARLGTSYASIDDPTSPGSPNTFREVAELVLSNPGAWCDCPVYRYVHPSSDVQPILVGYPKKATHISIDYTIAVKKVDASNPSCGLSGASFRLESVTDSSFTPRTGTTNASGAYNFTGLDAGTYTVTEVSAPSGYQIDNPSPVYVTLPEGDGTVVTKTFMDTPTITVSGTIRKVDRDYPTRGLAGATIAVQGIDNAFYGEFQTGAGGALEGLDWNQLLPGNYRAWEIAAPEGYVLDSSDVKTFRVSTLQPDVRLVFQDDSKVRVQLLKTDNSNRPLAGAVFNVLKDGRIIATEATDNEGKILVTGVTEGLYTFVEVSAPEGYAKLDEPVSVHVDQADIDGGGTITVTAADKRLPDLTIQKRDAVTGEAVPGTVFEVRGISSGYREEVTTGANGNAVLTGIPTGSYEVTEKSVPAPYVLGEDRTQTVWLEGGAQRTLVFTNQRKPTLNLLKVDALTSAPVPGTVFEVRGVGNSYRSDWTTGTDGTASETLEPGTYRVTEKSVPSPYYLPENAADREQTVSLSAGENKQLVFRDYRTPEVIIYKADSATGAAIAGAEFRVTYTSTGLSADAPASYDFGTLRTDASGRILLHEQGTRLYPGRYEITETKAAEGYQIREPSTQVVILSGSESKTVTFYNAPLNAIAVEKYDSVTGQAIAGATFRLRYLNGTSGTGGTVIGTKTTDTSGFAVWTDLEAGAYIVEEISPAPGYNIIQASETVYIQPNGRTEIITVTFYNAPDGSVLIRKIDSITRQPLADCEFLITDSTGAFVGNANGLYTTNSAGIIQIEGIAPGTTLVVRETRTRPGYVLDDTAQTITVQAGRVNTLEFRNAPKPGLVLLKKDAQTGAPLAGVTFAITDSRGAVVDYGEGASADGTYITDAEGRIVLNGLEPGTYFVRETATVSGYVLDETVHTVNLRSGETATVTLTNQKKSTLIIYKYDRATRQPLAGTEFTVTPVDPGDAVDNEGLTAAVYRTDETGALTLTNLTPAAYTVTEVTPPDDYALDSEPQTAVLRAGATQNLSFYNTHLTSLTILKRDSVTHAPLAGAEFRVVDVNGDPVGTTNGLYTSGPDGTITIPGLTPNTTLIVTEVSAPEGYVRNPTPQTITVRSGVVNELVMENVPGTTLIVNKFITGTNYEPLAGVEFLVTDSSGAVVGPDNGHFTTDRTGQFRITGLTPGTTITVREVRTAEGYVLDGQPQTLLIRAGEVQTLTFWNARMGTLIVRKVDSETGNPVPGTEFHITYADGRPVDLLHTGGSSGSSTGTGTASGTSTSGGATGGGSTVTSSNGRYVTDSRGEIVIPDITGTIVVTESRAAQGYAIDPDHRSETVTVNPTDAQTITFGNPRLLTLTIRKRDAVTHEPLAGAEFYVRESGGAAVGTFISGADGTALVSGLTPGVSLVVAEAYAPEGYTVDPTPQTIQVQTGGNNSLTFENRPTSTLLIRKTIAGTDGEPLEGVQFKVTDSSGAEIGPNGGLYTTNAAGEIRIVGIRSGTTVNVREVRTAEGCVLDGEPRTLLIQAGQEHTLQFENQRKGSLIVRKTDSETGEPLAGAGFHIAYADGRPVDQATDAAGSGGPSTVSSNGNYVTDSRGEIVLRDITGTVLITETQAPEGYAIDPDHRSETVTVTARDAQTITFGNPRLLALTIHKRDSVTGEPLSGAEFTVKDSGGETIGTYTTGEDGAVTVPGLVPDSTVVVSETKAPTGYVLNDRPQTYKVQTGRDNSVTFTNAPTGTLRIWKYVYGTDREPLSGAAFKVTDGSGRNIGTDDGVLYTDASGLIEIPGLTPGITIKAREIRTVDGYVLDGNPQDIEILPGAAQELVFWNKPAGSLIIEKRSAEGHEPLAGAEFHVAYADGRSVDDANGTVSSGGRYETDSRGQIIIHGVTGAVVVTETRAPEGYAVDPDHRSETVTVNPNDAQTLVFENPSLLTLTIRKRDALTGAALQGAEFTVREVGGQEIGTFTTGADGTAEVGGLLPSMSVSIKETKAPAGYVKSVGEQTVRMQSGRENAVTFENTPTTTLVIRKVIAGTSEPLAGVRFQITDSAGTAIGPDGGMFTTDQNGEICVTGLAPGTTVVVRETQTAEGFVLDGAARELLIRAGEQQTMLFENQRKGSLLVRKTDAETGEALAGAEFHIAYADGRPVDQATGDTSGGPAVTSSNGNYVTDSRGEIVLNDVVGTITVTETKAPQGYAVDPDNRTQTVTVTARDAQTLTFQNPSLLTLTIRKRDSVTGAALQGAEFYVKEVGGQEIGTFTTGEDGTAEVDGLLPGMSVSVKETKAPAGYVKSTAPKSVRMQSGRENAVTFENTPTTTLVVRKVIAGSSEPLAGVRFQITDSAGTSIGPDGGMFTTDRNGEIRVTGLAPGTTVVVRETQTAEGFVLDSTARQLLIREGEQQTILYENQRKGSLLIRKLDAATRQPLPGVEFTILHADGRPVDQANGQISSAGRYTTNENGEILINGVLGTLIVTEEKPAPGYVMDPDSRTRTVEVSANDAQTLVFTNAPKQSLTIRKYVENTTTPVPGTVFLVTDSAGNRLGPDNGEFTTDANGEAVVTDLTPGVTVTAKEIRAAAGFVEDGTPQSIYVRSGDAQSLTFYDTPKQSVVIRKYDQQTNRPLAGVTFLVTDAAGNRIGEYVTDENGEAVVYGLDPGMSLVIREIRTVSGYVLNSSPRTLIVGADGTASLMNAGGTAGNTAGSGTSGGSTGGSTVSGNTVSFYDEPLSTLVVKKYEAGTDYAPVAGAEFTITDGNGGAIGTTGGVFRTNSAGTITVEGLEPGTTVKVQETEAPEGYVLDGTPRTITIGSSEVHTLEFWNRKCGSLTVKKLDSATRQPIAGAEFKLAYTDGRPVDTANGHQSSDGQYFTDANGEIVVTGVTGSIVITETRPAEGYVLNPDSRSRTVEVRPDDAQTIAFLNTPTQTLTVRKTVTGTTRPVQGAEFLVTDATGAVVGENGGKYVTDEDGQFVVSGLTPGITLKVRETKAPEGFVLDSTEKSITIRAGNAQSLGFTNAPCGSLKIVKRDSLTDQPLANAEFQVLTSNGQYVPDRGGRLSGNGLYSTDSNGEILITGLDPVTLVVKETRAPEGYALDDTPQTVDILADEMQTLTFRDVPMERVIIRKYEEGTTNPLSGVRFQVTDGGNRPLGAGEYVTDGNGEITVNNVAPGTTIIAREVRTVSGYALNGQPQSLEVKSGEANTLTFYDAPLSILVVKKYIVGTDHEPLEGVQFHITDGNGKAVGATGGLFTTDETGTITVENLEPGTTLKVQETRTVSGFVLDGTPKTITIENSQVHTLEFQNQRMGSLTVVKQDSATHAPVPGTVFHIAYADGRPVDNANGTVSSNGRYTTDDNGEIHISGVTGTIVVTEEQPAPGYTMRADSRSQTVEIRPEDGQTLTFLNDPTQTLTVQKFVEGTTTPLPGAVFLITDSGGERLGTEDGRFTTDANGQIVLTGLVPGVTICVKEVQAPDGFALNPMQQNLKIKSGDSQTLTFFDTPKQTVTIRKLVQGTDRPLPGVTFAVTDAAGNRLGEYVTDDNGEIVLTGLDPGTTLVVREVRTVQGYVLNSNPQTIVVGGTATLTAVPASASGSGTASGGSAASVGTATAGAAGNTLTFRDEPLSVLVVKKYIAGTDHEPLEGVQFRITDGNGKAVGTTGGLFTTDETGTITVENLEPGTTLKVQETRTVPGFVLDGTPKTITIESSQVHELSFENQRAGSLTVVKQDSATHAPIPGTVFHIAYADGRPVDNANGTVSSNGRYTTDDNGEIHISGVTGTIVVTEEQPAQGYTMRADSRSQTVGVRPEDGQTLTFLNDPTQTLIVQKFAEGTTTPLQGAVFLISDSGGERLGTEDGRFTTDENGQIILSNLVPGVTITVKEVQAPEGYALDGTAKSIKIKAGESQTLTFYDAPKLTVTIRKLVQGTDQPLAGVAFAVTDATGRPYGAGEYVTDDSGSITIPGVDPGTILNVREVRTVSGYTLNGTAQRLEVKSGEANTLTFRDEPLSVLVVKKYIAGTDHEPLEGVQFRITDGNGKAVGTTGGLFTTDETGTITIPELEPGTTLKVQETQTVPGFVLDGTPKTITIESSQVHTLEFLNQRAGSLTVVKQDSVSHERLAGVVFHIAYADGRPVDNANGQQSSNGRYVTDDNGEIHISGVTGTVVVTEEQTIPGYTMRADNRSQTVEIRPEDGQTLTFLNDPTQTLTVQKLAEGTTTSLPGAVFLISDSGGERLGTEDGRFTTDENGQIILSNLVPGVTITAREVQAPQGYALDGTPKSIKIKSGESQTLTFYDTPKQSVTIRKLIQGTDRPLPGVTFAVTDAAGTRIGEYVTDANGEITIHGLDPGMTLIIRETATVQGYRLNPNPQTIVVGSGPSAVTSTVSTAAGSGTASGGAVSVGSGGTVTFHDEPLATLTIRKYVDGTDNQPLPGVTFKVTDGSGAAVGSSGGVFTTDAEGTITIRNLEPGTTVKAQETKTAEGYVLDGTPKQIQIRSGEANELVFWNKRAGTLVVHKQDAVTGAPLAGVEFHIAFAEGQPADTANGKLSSGGQYFTDEHGDIRIDGITGTLVITERETLPGYVLDPASRTRHITVNPAETQTVTITNTPKQSLTVAKYRTGTTTPIQGAAFLVTGPDGAAIGTANGEYLTDENGRFIVEGLTPGETVTVKEIRAASGFVLDGSPKTVTIRSGAAQSLTFYNTPEQTLVVQKLVEGTTTPIRGTTFQITDASGAPVGAAQGEFITDENGEIRVNGLAPGTVLTVKETKAADGFALDGSPKTVTIGSGEAQVLRFYNKPTGTLIITKRDRATNAALKGAEFQILTADGKFVDNAGGRLSSQGLYTTDDNGQIIITGLSKDTLVVHETRAPEGYLLDDSPQTVQVGPADTQTLNFYDDPEQSLTIQKFVAGTTDPIQGVTFLLTDGTGATIGPDQGEYTTDRNGRITITGLAPGTSVTAKEIRTASGFVLDTTPQTIQIKRGEGQKLTFYNQRDGGIELIKTDAADRTKRLPGAVFEIRRAEDGGLVKKITTGQDGRIYANLDAGSYYLVETEAPEGYRLDPAPEHFTVRDGRTTTVTVTNMAESGILLHKTNSATGKPIQGVTFLLYDSGNNPIGQYTTDDKGYIRMTDLTAGQYFLRELENKGYVPDTALKTVYVESGKTTLIEWKNVPLMAQIQITKKSADYNAVNGLPEGTPLEGAVFEIRDKAGNLVDTVKTDARGVASSQPLPLDRYTFKETTAPANYGLNENEFTAYLEFAGQIVRFEVTDRSLITGVSINKTGPQEVMAGQPVNYRFDHIGNTSNVRLDSFYWRDTLPAQVRLQKVVTGTYNYPGTYKITYRVNGSEPRTLADNLSTSRNYTLDASPVALGLASNERVTEIMFVFGQAPAGFAQVEAPSLLCTVIPNVLATSFVNVADVGGVYSNQWVQGVSRWVVQVYRKPGRLPKTGY